MTGGEAGAARVAPDAPWPRWQVFKQDRVDAPHEAVGSVHAVDAEHALLMARSVFARRPAAVSLWVTPADVVHAVTAEQLAAAAEAGAAPSETADAPAPEGAARRFVVFLKTTQRRSMSFVAHVGEVTATGPDEAVAAARRAFPDPPALVWWVVPEEHVSASPDAEAAAWFEPARAKTYKQQSRYGTLAGAHRKGDRR